MRIDVHCHLFQSVNSIDILNNQFKEFRGYGFFERILRYMEKTISIKTNNIIEKTIFHIKRAKIDKVVLLPLSIKENEKVKEWANYAPEIFIPFYNPPEKAIGNISIGETIENAVIKDNYRGLKIMLPFRKKNLNDKILYPALEVAQDREIIVLMHSGYPPPGTKRNALTYSNPVNVDELISSFPKLYFILAHMGFPWSDIAIALAMQYPNVYLDISNLSYMQPNNLKKLLIQAKEIIGVDKILYGSDVFVPEQIEMTVNYFNNINFLTNEEVEKIFGLNALKLLKLG